MRKGVSPLVSAVLYVAIAVAVVGIVLSVGTPILDRIQDTGAITNSIDFLQDVDALVQQVRAEGRYSARPIRLNFDRGKYVFDNTTGEFYYELDTRSNFISAHSSQRRGNLLIAANADVSVTETEVDGTDCYMMENEHLKTCVRKIPAEFDPEDHPDLTGFWRFDEGSGQWANDTAGDNDGTLGGSTASEASDPSWTSGIYLNALEFDGSDDYVEVPDDDSLDITSGATISAWIKPSKDGSEGRWINSIGRVTYRKASNEDLELMLHIDGGWRTATIPASDWTGDTWIHVVGTYDGSNYRAYLNGAEKDDVSISGSITTNNNDWGIGARLGSPPDNHFNGKIDSVRVYDRALTAEEVEWLHLQRGDINYINTSELLLTLRNKDLDEDLDPTMTVLANANDRTIHGTGSAVAEQTGGHLGRGRVTARVNSSYGLNYDLNIDLISGSDFLKADVIER